MKRADGQTEENSQEYGQKDDGNDQNGGKKSERENDCGCGKKK